MANPHIIGFIPKSDCSDYSPELRTPTWSELIAYLGKQEIRGRTPFKLGFCGKVYMGVKRECDCYFTVTDPNAVRATPGKVPSRGIRTVREPLNTIPYALELIGGGVVPGRWEHVTAITVEEL